MATLLLLLAVASSTQQPLVVEFYSSSSPDCVAMEPVVTQLQSDGFPINRVDVDLYPESMSKHDIQVLPCYVARTGSDEVMRLTGRVSRDELVSLLPRTKEGGRGRRVTEGLKLDPLAKSRSLTQIPPRIPAESPTSAAFSEATLRRVLRATVRIRVYSQSGRSSGSGTVIAREGSRALVATCGHVFGGASQDSPVTVTVFSDEGERDFTGSVLSCDTEQDVGLVLVAGIGDVPVIPLASSGSKTARGEPIAVAGCDHGASPTVAVSRAISSTTSGENATLVIEATPAHGRSGGGAFNSRAELIGVCNGFTPSGGKGIYAGLGAVLAELAENRVEPR